MRVTIIIPARNELEGLKRALAQIKKEWYEQIIVLDGQSTDGTQEWFNAHYDEMADFNVSLFVQKEKGLWNAYRELFLSNVVEGDYVITMSPDENCPISDIPKLEEKLSHGYDMVIASRYLGGTASQDDTPLTAFGNHLLTRICNGLNDNVYYTDALNMYRAYRVNLIKQLGFEEKPNWLQKILINMTSLYSFEPSLSIRAGKHNLCVAEIQSSEPKAYRERRQNTLVHGTAILTQIIHEGLRRV